MKRILLTSAALAVAGSSAFAGGVAPAMVEPEPMVVTEAPSGSLGGAALPLLLGGAAAVGAAALVLSDDDDDDDTVGTTTN